MNYSNANTMLSTNERTLLKYLKSSAGLKNKYTDDFYPVQECRDLLSKLVLIADPDQKIKVSNDFFKYLPTIIMDESEVLPNGQYEKIQPEVFYLPVKKQNLGTKLSFAVSELITRLNLATELYVSMAKGDIEGEKRIMYNTKEDGVLVQKNFTLSQIKSIMSDIKSDISRAITLQTKCMKIYSKKGGGKSYRLSQVTLSKVNSDFLSLLKNMVSQILMKSLQSDSNLKTNLLYFYEKRVNFLESNKIKFYEGSNAEIKYEKKTISGEKTLIFPVDYESLANLISGLIAKWVSKSVPSSGTASSERSERMARLGSSLEAYSDVRNSIIEYIRSVLNVDTGVDNSDLSQTFQNSAFLYSEPNNGVYNTKYNVNYLLELYQNLGGDTSVIPPSFQIIGDINDSQNPLTLLSNSFDSIFDISNQRLMYALFKVVSDNSTLTTGASARKRLPVELENILLSIKDKNNSSILLNINKVKSTNSINSNDSALILSESAFDSIDEQNLRKSFQNYHSNSNYGILQKGIMTLTSLVKTGKSLDLTKEEIDQTQKQISLISFFCEYYKWSNREALTKIKDEKANEKANEQKRLKKSRKSTTSLGSPITSFETNQQAQSPPMFPNQQAQSPPMFPNQQAQSPPMYNQHAQSPLMLPTQQTRSQSMFGDEIRINNDETNLFFDRLNEDKGIDQVRSDLVLEAPKKEFTTDIRNLSVVNSIRNNDEDKLEEDVSELEEDASSPLRQVASSPLRQVASSPLRSSQSLSPPLRSSQSASSQSRSSGLSSVKSQNLPEGGFDFEE